MADEVRAGINVEIDATSAIAQLRQLQATISSVNKSLIAGDREAARSQQLWRDALISNIQQGRAFSASIQNVESSVVRLSRSIEKNQLTVGQSFGLWRQSLAKYRAEQGAVNDLQRVAEQRARNLQTQYIALGDSVNGVSKAVAMRPLGIFNADLAVNAQRMQLMGRVLDQGSTALVNWGKNTQWAGRQLMVGLGIPITIFGASAAKVFTDLEKSTIAFKRVYGDLGVSDQEKNAALAGIQELAAEFTKYGIAVTDTINLSAKAAAAGFQGEDLIAQTTEATRLATLGQIDYQQALEATITLNSAFGVTSEELAQKIDFLNAAENQTVLSLDDISRAIPRVGPVVRQLGGDVEDLAVLMTALREGGVTAEQGANAIKSGLASLINPTNKAVEVLKKYGINIKAIVKENEGELLPTVKAAADAFDTLSGPDRQRALETLFGKFQYARLGALFDNINKDGSQAARTMELMGYSTEQLAEIAEGELATVEQAISVKFTAALEKAKLAIAPIGEQFLKIATPIIDVGTRILDKFQELPDGIKTFATIAVAAIGLIIPTVIMLTGLFANLFGTGFKLATNFLRVIGVLPKAIDFQTEAEQRATAATESLESASGRAATAALRQSSAVDSLNNSLRDYIALAGRASRSNFVGGRNPAVGSVRPVSTFARGGQVGGRGNKDTEPALLTPGEFVVNAKAAKKFLPILAAMNEGSIAGYNRGTKVKGSVSVGGESLDIFATENVAAQFQRVVDRLLENGYSVAEVLEKIRSNFSVTADGLYSVTGPLIKDFKRIENGLASWSMLKLEQTHLGGLETEITGVERVVSVLKGNLDKLQGAARSTAERVIQLGEAGALRSAALLGGAKINLPELFNQQMKAGGVGVSGTQLAQYLRSLSEEEINNLFAPLKGYSGDLQDKMRLIGSWADNFESAGDQLYKDTETADGRIKNFGSTILEISAGVEGAGEQFISSVIGAQQSFELLRVRLDKTNAAVTGADIALFESGRGGTATKPLGTTVDAIGAGVMQGAQVSSPPPWSIDLGRFISDGIEKGTLTGLESLDDIVKQFWQEQVQVAQAAQQEMAGQLDLFNQPSIEPEQLSLFDPIDPDAGRVTDINQAFDEAKIENDHFDALKENSERLSESSEELDSSTREQKNAKKKIGKLALKAQGAFFALDGLVFGLSMLDNNIGQMAQNILPAVFGIQALTGILPMLMNPIGLAIAAIGATAIGFWYLDNKRKELQEKIIKNSIAMDGSAKAFDELSKEFGTLKPSEKFGKLFAGFEKIDEESAAIADQFIEGENGKAMLERARSVAGSKRKSTIERELLQSIAFGIITPEQARAVAASLASALKDYPLGAALSASISDYVRNNSESVIKPIKDLVGSVQEDIDSIIVGYTDIKSLEDELAELREKRAQSGQVNQVTGEVAPFFDPVKDAERLAEIEGELSKTGGSLTENIGPLINATKKLSEAQNFLNIQYREGKINLDEFNDLTQIIQQSQQNLATTLQNMQISTSDPIFSENLKMAALASGMLEEDFGKMEEQARALEGVLASTFGKDSDWAKKASNTLQLALTGGALDMGEAGSIPELLSNKEYSAVLNLAIEGDDPTVLASVVKGLNEIDMLPEPLKASMTMDAESNMGSPEEFNAWLQRAMVGASYFVDHPNLNMQAFFEIKEGESTTEDINRIEGIVDKFEKNPEISAEIDFKTVSLDNLQEADQKWNSLGKKKNISKIIKAEDQYSDTVRGFVDSWAQLDSLPNIVKQAILLKLEVLAKIDVSLKGAVDSKNKAATEYYEGKQQDFVQDIKDLINIGLDFGDGGGGGGGDTGGGSQEKSYLETLNEGLNANALLYLNAQGGFDKYFKARGKFFGAFNKLRGLGFSESAIAALGTGIEGAKKAAELLGLDQQARKELIKKMEAEQVGTTIEGIRSARATAQQKTAGARALSRFGAEEEVTKAIMDDEETLLAFAVANKKEREAIVRAKRKEIAAQKELKALQDPKGSQIEAINKQMKLETIAFERSMRQMDKDIDKQQKVIDLIQDEIDGIEQLNAADERLIRDKDRQIESYNRQIDGVERLIEKEQDRIDVLKEEDEQRNRRSTALSRDLEILSEKESEIQDLYQERMKALEQVFTMNERIIQQQKDQLNIAQALSQGDIYAATAAVRDAQQNEMQAAQEQQRAALEQGRENEIAALRTPEGLTREQAEKEIANIKEQSYQTSLLIQGIEDVIQKKNKEIEGIKRSIRDVEDEKLKIQDRIYDRETLILSIQTQRLAPAQQEYETLVDKRDEMKKIFDTRIEDLKLQVENLELTNDEINAVNALGDSWIRVGNAITNANWARKQGLEKLGAAPVRIPTESYDEWQARITTWQNSRRALESTYNSSVSSAIATGDAASANVSSATRPIGNGMGGAFAGGLMKEYYGGGSVIGSGARDSIVSMLAPGEFVVRKAMVDKYGLPMFESLNQGSFSMPRYNTQTPSAGNVKVNSQNTSSIVAPMYNNYSVNVSVSNSNASADEIANKTIMKIKQMQDMQIRGGRGY